MAMVHRVLAVWCVILVFLICLVIRLDKQNDWYWFIIFIPLFLFDVLLIFFALFRVVLHLKQGYDTNELTIKRKFWFLSLVCAKLTFLVVLCARLEKLITVPYYYVFIPLWAFLLGLACDATTWVWVMANAGG